MPKKIKSNIQFRLPRGTGNFTLSFPPSGEIVVTDKNGNVVVPEEMERTVHYDRAKGPKVQTRFHVDGGSVSVGGLSELTKYDSVFVIDTNSRTIGDEIISAACFICLRFHQEGEKARIEVKGHLNVYEFHDVPGNPEMLAILKVANDVLRSAGKGAKLECGFVTDSELGAHDAINSRRQPIYGTHYLPEGFSLQYASSDTGQEALNKLIRICDRQSCEYLQSLEQGAVIKKSSLKPLAEESLVSYSYYSREIIEIVNPVVGGLKLQPGISKIDVYGVKNTL